MTATADDKLRAAIEKPREVFFWGQASTITPRFVAEILGDGRQLIWFETMNHRPNYYVIRVDSSWAVSFDGDPTDYVCDHHAEICDAIADEYGEMCRGEDECDDADCCDCDRGFPELSASSGASWGDFDRLSEETAAAMGVADEHSTANEEHPIIK